MRYNRLGGISLVSVQRYLKSPLKPKLLQMLLPNLGENILRQFRLHHNISGLRSSQEAAPRPIRGVEDLGVLQLGVVWH